jgi:hypothetical protein
VIKNLKIVLLAWLLAMASSGALARNLVVDRAIFEDPTGQLDLKVVKTSVFAAAPEIVFKGFSRLLDVNYPDRSATTILAGGSGERSQSITCLS